ncbi:MAG TPA: VOC family protein, partial [Verrucomicrobiae bacterium]|nr:VOC family protein [Verrucomicrobiae bacterium]
MKVKLGQVGHFGLAVRDPQASAAWWSRHFDLAEMFRFEDGVGMTNDAITIVFHRGVPHPGAIDHVSFHVENMDALRAALASLSEAGVK